MSDESRTKLEFIYNDVLGDVDKLVKQIEAVSANIGTTYDGAIERLAEHEKNVAALITREADKSCQQMTAALRDRFAEVYRSANSIAHKAEKAALLIDRAAWRLLVMSLVGGVVGGLLSVIGYIVIVNFVL